MLGRTGRIPPLPKGYSPALTSVIKAMLNLNVSELTRARYCDLRLSSLPCVPLRNNYSTTNVSSLHSRSARPRSCELRHHCLITHS